MTQTINEPLVVICMATYNPPVDLFAKQIESIINQTFQNWVCIINDDNSDEEIYSEIQKIASKDKRFSVYRNESQLGFYYNFEKCLFHVPQEAEFVGFADQDDYWHKEKLEKTLAEFDSGTNLVFCDMNIVDRDGKILHNTYWR